MFYGHDATSETRERLSHKTCNAIDEKTETPELKGFASYLSYLTNILQDLSDFSQICGPKNYEISISLTSKLKLYKDFSLNN